MAGHALIERVNALLQARRFADAAQLLTSAADGGDPAALIELAHWRIAGSIIRRDLQAARDLLRRAGEAGRANAALTHCYFLASGVGGPADWSRALAELRKLAPAMPEAARQLPLLERMELDADGSPTNLEVPRELSAAPYAAAFLNLFTAEECAYLRSFGQSRYQPSVVVDPRTGGMVPHPVRRSSGTFFSIFDEDLVVNALNRRIAAASGTTAGQGEPLQLLRYEPGNEYKTHLDALHGEQNQRILTVLVYLTEGYDGGETHFPRTGLSYKGGIGDALLFRNVTEDGRPDRMAEHAGRPVLKGVKIIASRWVRAQPFAFPPPQPVLDR
jgi:prolyl 4-hydroxylase